MKTQTSPWEPHKMLWRFMALRGRWTRRLNHDNMAAAWPATWRNLLTMGTEQQLPSLTQDQAMPCSWYQSLTQECAEPHTWPYIFWYDSKLNLTPDASLLAHNQMGLTGSTRKADIKRLQKSTSRCCSVVQCCSWSDLFWCKIHLFPSKHSFLHEHFCVFLFLFFLFLP